jgi:hypothetical protein
VQSTVKGLKRKRKEKTKAYATSYFFSLHKKKCEDLRVLDLSAKIYSRVFGLVATLDPKIILIIILNLH